MFCFQQMELNIVAQSWRIFEEIVLSILDIDKIKILNPQNTPFVFQYIIIMYSKTWYQMKSN